jgi:DNA-directed RNA polymerase subunit RPC12/RpoP
MNTDKTKPKPTPATCPECGAPTIKAGYLCVACSRPMPNATYWERRRDREGFDRIGLGPSGAHDLLQAATRRHFSR